MNDMIPGTAQDDDPGNDRPDAEGFPPPHPDVPPTPTDNHHTYYHRPDQTPIGKWFLEVVALVVVLGYTLAAYRQLDTMDKTYKEIIKQTPEVAKSADAAKIQAEISKTQLLSSHRPWVTFNGAIITSQPLTFDAQHKSASSRVSFSLKNVGWSPAMGVSIFPSIRFLGDILHESPCSRRDLNELARLGVGIMMVPGDIRKFRRLGVISRVEDTWASTGWQYGPPVLEICILYRDEFGNPHITGQHLLYKQAKRAGWVAFPPVEPKPGTVAGVWQDVSAPATAY